MARIRCNSPHTLLEIEIIYSLILKCITLAAYSAVHVIRNKSLKGLRGRRPLLIRESAFSEELTTLDRSKGKTEKKKKKKKALNLGIKDVPTQQGMKMQAADSVWGGLPLELETSPPGVAEEPKGQELAINELMELVSGFYTCF